MQKDIHPRCHENIASLMVALNVLYSYAKHCRVISKEEKCELLIEDFKNLESLMYHQSAIAYDKNPGNIITNIIGHGLRTGLYHFNDYKSNLKPTVRNPEYLGWTNNRPNGEHLGWVDSNTGDVYIKSELDISLLTNRLSQDDKKFIPTTHKAFWITMKASSTLKSYENGGNRVRRTRPDTKKSMTVYHLNLKHSAKKSGLEAL